MTKKLAKTNGYRELVAKIQKELTSLELTLKQKTAQTYWNIGCYISEHLLENQERANYGEYLFEHLSRDVGRSKDTLHRATQFYRTYPIVARAQQLTWRHYQALLSIKDEEKRKELERQAILKNWNSDQLRRRISWLKQRQQRIKKPKIISALAFTRGRLNTFRLLESKILPSGEESGILIDCGFQVREPLETTKSNLKPGDCIEVIPKGKSYSINKVTIEKDELFTYQAVVTKVVDGDTLWALIDPGLGSLIEQNLRLRGIDCPEVSTKAGQKAKRFVQSQLKDLDFIIIKTYKDRTGKYGRYLTDVFYLKGEDDPQKVLEQGTFLNQQLLDLGLAKVME